MLNLAEIQKKIENKEDLVELSSDEIQLLLNEKVKLKTLIIDMTANLVSSDIIKLMEDKYAIICSKLWIEEDSYDNIYHRLSVFIEHKQPVTLTQLRSYFWLTKIAGKNSFSERWGWMKRDFELYLDHNWKLLIEEKHAKNSKSYQIKSI